MESTSEDETLIEKFLTNELTLAEKEAFAIRKKDPVFAEQLRFHEDLQVVATHAGKFALKNRLRQVEKKHQSPKIIQLGLRQILAVAATILVLLTAGTFWYAQANYSNQALFTSYYSAPNFSATRSATQDPSYSNATQAFYKGDYEKTITVLQNENQNTSTSGLLLAHAYLKINQPDLALRQRPVVESTSTEEEWQWVEVLALLANNKTSELKVLLDEFTQNPNHLYYKKAQSLKEQVQSNWRFLIK